MTAKMRCFLVIIIKTEMCTLQNFRTRYKSGEKPKIKHAVKGPYCVCRPNQPIVSIQLRIELRKLRLTGLHFSSYQLVCPQNRQSQLLQTTF